MKTELTQEYLKECFTYDSITGKLIWKVRPLNHFQSERVWKMLNTQFSLKEAGYINTRTDSKRKDFAYRVVTLDKGHYKAHRLIYLYEKGFIPAIIDHKDGNPLNNKIDNLREATIKQNGQNSKTPINSSTGYKNIGNHRGGYRVTIEIDEKGYATPKINDIEEAKYICNHIYSLLYGEFSVFHKATFIPEDGYEFKGKLFTHHIPRLLEERNNC